MSVPVQSQNNTAEAETATREEFNKQYSEAVSNKAFTSISSSANSNSSTQRRASAFKKHTSNNTSLNKTRKRIFFANTNKSSVFDLNDSASKLYDDDHLTSPKQPMKPEVTTLNEQQREELYQQLSGSIGQQQHHERDFQLPALKQLHQLDPLVVSHSTQQPSYKANQRQRYNQRSKSVIVTSIQPIGSTPPPTTVTSPQQLTAAAQQRRWSIASSNAADIQPLFQNAMKLQRPSKQRKAPRLRLQRKKPQPVREEEESDWLKSENQRLASAEEMNDETTASMHQRRKSVVSLALNEVKEASPIVQSNNQIIDKMVEAELFLLDQQTENHQLQHFAREQEKQAPYSSPKIEAEQSEQPASPLKQEIERARKRRQSVNVSNIDSVIQILKQVQHEVKEERRKSIAGAQYRDSLAEAKSASIIAEQIAKHEATRAAIRSDKKKAASISKTKKAELEHTLVLTNEEVEKFAAQDPQQLRNAEIRRSEPQQVQQQDLTTDSTDLTSEELEHRSYSPFKTPSRQDILNRKRETARRYSLPAQLLHSQHKRIMTMPQSIEPSVAIARSPINRK